MYRFPILFDSFYSNTLNLQQLQFPEIWELSDPPSPDFMSGIDRNDTI